MIKPFLYLFYQRVKVWAFPCICFLFAFVVIRFLYNELHQIDVNLVIQEAKSIPTQKIAFSILLMIFSYWVLTFYELLAVRYAESTYAKTPVPYRRIALTSFLAYAIGNNVGAAVSGGAIRYRMYRLLEMSRSQIAKIIVFISLSFALAIALVLGLALLIEPLAVDAALSLPHGLIRLLGLFLLLIVTLYCVWTLWFRKSLIIKHIVVDAPDQTIVLKQFLVGVVDISLAASVIYILFPSENMPEFLTFLAIFLIAMTLGIVSSVPGGVGVFESVLLLSLNNIDVETLLGIVIVYRIIYFLIPLIFALTALLIYEMSLQRKKIMRFISGA